MGRRNLRRLPLRRQHRESQPRFRAGRPPLRPRRQANHGTARPGGVSNYKLAEFFLERRTGYDWIHRAGTYDILLFVVGFPLAIWTCMKIGVVVHVDSLNILPRTIR